ncbi:cadherin-like protein 26 [Danio rerio]|uniref:Cadherin-like protein 26 n=2 Tax=Danio rerio TaxID=7955 RepID=E7F370_DANRE|nr:cadherin-like protein 26 [Danio rerio]|eukprot:XP_017209214.1 cadherin-like protein 26 [Danio rerio]
MMKAAVFLLLFTLGELSASYTNDTSSRQKRDAVLIRTKRRWVLSTIDLEENMRGPFPLEVTQMFNDKKQENVKFRISGEGVTTPPIGLFSINENTGSVFVHRAIDREINPIFHVDFDVLDKDTGAPLDRTLSFNVEIKDLNDNAPLFTPTTIPASVPENALEGPIQATLQAHDNDQKDTYNSEFTMRVVSQDPAVPVFSLRDMPQTNKYKQLAFSGCFDFDKAKTYKVLIEAKDKGTPPMSSTATVIVNITDSNTHQPEFSSTTYNAEVMEMESNKEILRINITDKDTPNTPASRAVFSILKGNEEGYYRIVTDPKTNQGVLSVIKGKNFEKTEITQLEIAVENEEKIFQCVDGKRTSAPPPKPQTTKVAVKVIDLNDPPVFKKVIEKVYRNENGKPGDVLFTPDIKDEDSDVNNIRYELVKDPAKWVSVDPKTGKITTVQTMDRESPFVRNGTYTVVVQAIDDGQPPATGTCTVVVYLGDLNDNAPYLPSNKTVMCANNMNRVRVFPADDDAPPFSGPFTFSLGDEEMKKLWKLDPTTGLNSSLISLTSLPYGNYTVPLKIQDQQALQSDVVMFVSVCECSSPHTCRGLLPLSSRLGPAAIGLMIAGLLLLALLLLFSFLCDCNSKNFQHIPLSLQDEGNQTLVKYNDEGGGSVFRPESMLVSNLAMKESIKVASAPAVDYVATDGFRRSENGTMRSPGYNPQYFSGAFQEMSNGGGVMSMPYQSWSTVRRERESFRNGGAQLTRGYSVSRVDRNLAEHIERKISGFPEEQRDYPVYSPYQYEYEGRGSDCQSLDQLSVSNLGDNLDFLQHLGPKFNNLGKICQQPVNHRNTQL